MRPTTPVSDLATVLVTGFEPFDKAALNPSWEIARALDGRVLPGGARVVAVQLPCVFGDALAALDAALVQHQPTVVIALGLAGGRTALSIERVAINVDDARIADNAGKQPIDAAVVAQAPVAYFARLPIKHAVDAVRKAGFAFGHGGRCVCQGRTILVFRGADAGNTARTRTVCGLDDRHGVSVDGVCGATVSVVLHP
mgnify:CR=1 FL=1